MTRRELMRVGGSALLGLSLADILNVQQRARATEPAAPARSQGPGFGRAKSVILCYLQGGPSHLDLWDPKDNCPERVRSTFSAINTCLTGTRVTELLPRLAKQADKYAIVRSINHTHTGHNSAMY